jgi:CheY-like chemotaxis protein
VQTAGDGKVILAFVIIDTGIGIPADKLATLFRPFTQADTSMSRLYGGSGLGLAICARLVSLMGGTIAAKSEVNSGSRFEFTAEFQYSTAALLPVPMAEPSKLAGIRVLVVDDNATNRRILLDTLKAWGMDLAEACDGSSALAAIQQALRDQKRFRLLIVDGHMPGMDGFTLAERIRQSPETSGTIIMMLTSAGQRGDAARCRELGITTYLLKPIRRNELLRAVLATLGQPTAGEAVSLVTRHTLRQSGRVLRVLVAEDNVVNQVLIRRLLEKAGHRATVVPNGADAVELAAREPFDVILMDVQMPGMDGFAATAVIREHERGRDVHIPIIALTAHAVAGYRERCIASGMDGYLAKPIRFPELCQALVMFSGAAPALDSKTLWDRDQARANAGEDPALLAELLSIFVQEAPQLLQRIREAVQKNDAAEVERQAHALKGELGCIGALSVAERARRLEEFGRSGSLQTAAAEVAALTQDLKSLLHTLNDFNEAQHECFSGG